MNSVITNLGDRDIYFLTTVVVNVKLLSLSLYLTCYNKTILGFIIASWAFKTMYM